MGMKKKPYVDSNITNIIFHQLAEMRCTNQLSIKSRYVVFGNHDVSHRNTHCMSGCVEELVVEMADSWDVLVVVLSCFGKKDCICAYNHTLCSEPGGILSKECIFVMTPLIPWENKNES